MRKPRTPEIIDLLDRAKAGENLTKGETEALLKHNPGYSFRYFPDSRPETKDQPGLNKHAEEAFKQSLTDTRPRWRMLGRSEPILHEDDYMMLFLSQNKDGSFEWDIMVDGDPLTSPGREDTLMKAALMGAKAWEVEKYKREFVEPNIPKAFLTIDPPGKAMSWTIDKLVLWAVEAKATAIPEEVRTSLTVEGLQGTSLPDEALGALLAYRRLNSAARLRKIRSIVNRLPRKASPPGVG